MATPAKLTPADLAPGDAKTQAFDFSGIEVARICSVDDPLFRIAYQRLWHEFGADNTMEALEVIERRLSWNPAVKIGDCWLRYEMILVQRVRPGQQPEFAAVRDQTAIVSGSTEEP